MDGRQTTQEQRLADQRTRNIDVANMLISRAVSDIKTLDLYLQTFCSWRESQEIAEYVRLWMDMEFERGGSRQHLGEEIDQRLKVALRNAGTEVDEIFPAGRGVESQVELASLMIHAIMDSIRTINGFLMAFCPPGVPAEIMIHLQPYLREHVGAVDYQSVNYSPISALIRKGLCYANPGLPHDNSVNGAHTGTTGDHSGTDGEARGEQGSAAGEMRNGTVLDDGA
jgi:hypothetical protein